MDHVYGGVLLCGWCVGSVIGVVISRFFVLLFFAG